MIIPDGIHDGREKGLFEASECSKGAAPIFAISHEVTARLNQKKNHHWKEKEEEEERKEGEDKGKKREREEAFFAKALMLLQREYIAFLLRALSTAFRPTFSKLRPARNIIRKPCCITFRVSRCFLFPSNQDQACNNNLSFSCTETILFWRNHEITWPFSSQKEREEDTRRVERR